jgi:hypothetical protein
MRIGVMTLLVMVTSPLLAQKGFRLVEQRAAKKIEVWHNHTLLTAYCYFDSTEKPVLFPIRTVTGNIITRGYPVTPRAGERTDHPHHVGLWLNYESVNGLDFWNNSSAIPANKKQDYGSIRHQQVRKIKNGTQGRLVTTSHWVNQQGVVLLEETTAFVFSVEGKSFIIDRSSTLKSVQPEVLFKDVKDGLLGLRVARALEMPSQQEDTFVDAHGNATVTKQMDNAGVTGMYVNKEGITGDATWAKRSIWTCLNGIKDGEAISIAIIDHPANIGYPVYWHARGYGLFAANPLGQKIFSEGKQELNLRLKQNEQATFRYRVVIHSGEHLTPAQIDAMANDFKK